MKGGIKLSDKKKLGDVVDNKSTIIFGVNLPILVPITVNTFCVQFKIYKLMFHCGKSVNHVDLRHHI